MIDSFITNRQRRLAVVSIVVLLTGACALAGCGGNDDRALKQQAEFDKKGPPEMPPEMLTPPPQNP